MDAEMDSIRRDMDSLRVGDGISGLAALRARLLDTRGAAVDVDDVRALTARLLAVLQRDMGASSESLLLVAAIALLARDDHAARTAALETGALSLVGALRGPPGATPSDRVERVALAATLLLMKGFEELAAHAEMGVAASLVRALASSTASVVTLALQGMLGLACSGSSAGRLACLNAAAVVPLCSVFRDSGPGDRALAARVLCALVDDAGIVAALSEEETRVLNHYLPALRQSREPEEPVSTELAECVLKRIVVQSDSPVDPVRALLTEVSGEETMPLLALEDLSALLWACEAATAQAAVDDGLVPICLSRLLTSREDDDPVRNAAAFVLMGVLIYHTALHGVVREAVTFAALVEQLSRGNLAAVLVLGPLVDGDDQARTEAAAAGAVAALARVLRDGLDQQKFVAARALSRLVPLDDVVREEALNANAVELLLRFLPLTAGYGKIHVLTAIEWLVRSTSRSHSAARDTFLRAGGAPVFVQTLAESDGLERFATGDVMLTIATDHAVAQAAFVEAGAVPPLIQFFLLSGHGSACPTAAQVLGCLAHHNASVKTALATDGRVLPRFVELLSTGSSDEIVSSAYALGRIAMGETTAQTAVAEAGAIEALIRVVETGPEQEALSATVALGAVVLQNKENQASAVRANALQALVGIMRHGGVTEATAWSTLAQILGHTEPVETAETIRTDVCKLVVAMLDQEPLTAAETIELLVTINPVNRPTALDAGALAALIAVIGDKERRLATTSAARALAFLVNRNGTAKTLALESYAAVEVLVDALREEELAEARVALLMALRCLVEGYAEAKSAFLATRALSLFCELMLLDVSISVNVTAQAIAVVYMLVEDGDPRAIDAVWGEGIVKPLLTILRTTAEEGVRVAVLGMVSLLSTDSSRLDTLCELFPLEDVLEMIPTASDSLKFNSLSAVCVITEHDSARRRVAVDRGVLAVAVDMIRVPGPYPHGILYPCAWVAALVAHDAHAERVAVEELGVVELLVGRLPTLHTVELGMAAVALASIRAAQSQAPASGVLEPLLELIGSDTAPDNLKASAVSALANLVERHEANQSACADAGAIPLVLTLVTRAASTSVVSIQRKRHAARALAALVDGNSHVQRLATQEGVVEQLSGLFKESQGLHDEQTTAFIETALSQLARSEKRDEAVVDGHDAKTAPAVVETTTVPASIGA